MPKKKTPVDSDVESDDEELHAVQKGAMKREAPAASTRPRRATAGNVQKLTKKLMAGDDEDEEEEDEYPDIPKAVLTKYKDSINAAPGTIHVIRKAEVAPAMLKALKVAQWPVWSSETGGWPDLDHPYDYEHPLRELSLFMEGSCCVAPEGGQSVELHAGDFAVFPKKLVCTWTILEPVKKHYIEIK